ncbi:MAG: DUF418 domain-containing protein [Hyphomonadaceae bacterium]|nr:DUF418 domain-containing protein [Hyphomonadaceae bacterium]
MSETQPLPLPVAQAQRMDMVDALRGFALMGLFLIHAIEFFELYWANPVGGPVHEVVFGLFAGKSYALFALCFGLSFHIIMDRAAARGVDFSGRFAWRLIILFGFGYLHGLIYRGDILTILALFGLTLIVFNRIRNNWVLIAIAAVCFLQPQHFFLTASAIEGAGWANQPPAYWSDPTIQTFVSGSFADVLAVNLVDGNLQKVGFYWATGRMEQIIGLFLVGLVLGRIEFFRRPETFLVARRVALGGLIALAVSLDSLLPWLMSMVPETHGPMARAWFNMAVTNIVDNAFMFIQVLVFVELWRGVGKSVLGVLAPAGRMTLTLYVGQSLVFVPIFYGYGLGLHDDLSQMQALMLGILAFALQLIGAKVWYRYFRYGPLEWLWRALTYTTWSVPFAKARSAA